MRDPAAVLFDVSSTDPLGVAELLGKSLASGQKYLDTWKKYEKDLKEFLEKKELLSYVPGIRELTERFPHEIKTPRDVAVDVNGKRKEIATKDLPTDFPISDIGTETIQEYGGIIKDSKSIVISGPLGIFENKEFAKGTKEILEAVAESQGFSLVGGGHTVAAVEQLGLKTKMGYVSTAGGALIEFLMGEKLPGVEALKTAASREH